MFSFSSFFVMYYLQIEGNAGDSLEVLSALDGVKSSMEVCSKVLVEAEKLKKLTEELDDVFKTNDFQKVPVRTYSHVRIQPFEGRSYWELIVCNTYIWHLHLIIQQVAEYIHSMQYSLHILKDIPQFQDKYVFLPNPLFSLLTKSQP